MMSAIGKDEARAALGAVVGAQRELATLACPPWRHAAFALCEAVLVATPAVAFGWRIALFVAVMAGIIACVMSDRRRLGVFINGYRRGRTRRVALLLLLGIAALYIASVWASLHAGMPLLSLALAVITFGISYWGSVTWQRVFVREMQEA